MSEATATKKKELYEHRRFVFMTLDPVHIGAGGYRLGRVDNTITREPGTNLPKIPGTSLAGAARSYAAISGPAIATTTPCCRLAARR